MNALLNGRRLARILTAVAASGLLGACSVLPERSPPPPVYDLGPVPIETTGQAGHSALVMKMATNTAYDDRAIYYRRQYREPARLYRYQQARWIDSPAKLLEERLRVRLTDRAQELGSFSGTVARYRLEGRLESFEQRYLGPDSAEAVVRIHVTLTAPTERRLIAQRLIAVRVPTGSGPQGAVSGLTEAASRSVEQIVDWLAGLGRVRDNGTGSDEEGGA